MAEEARVEKQPDETTPVPTTFDAVSPVRITVTDEALETLLDLLSIERVRAHIAGVSRG